MGVSIMVQFPASIQMELDGRMVEFYVKQISTNVFALSDGLHQLENADHMTFGYVIYQGDCLYSYGMAPNGGHDEEGKELYNFQIVHMVHLGPADAMETKTDLLERMLREILEAFVRRSRYKVRHPANLMAEQFASLTDSLKEHFKDGGPHATNPYLTPLYEAAVSMRDFYQTLVDAYEKLNADYPDG